MKISIRLLSEFCFINKEFLLVWMLLSPRVLYFLQYLQPLLFNQKLRPYIQVLLLFQQMNFVLVEGKIIHFPVLIIMYD